MTTYEAKQENSLSQGMIGLVGSHTGLSVQVQVYTHTNDVSYAP